MLATGEYIQCFVPKCGCKAEGVIPSAPDEVYPICAKHAAQWRDSVHRNRLLPKIEAQFGRWGAEKILRRWAETEAVGVPLESWGAL